MRDSSLIVTFFDTIAEDPRMGANHIIVYFALRTLWLKSDCPAMLEFFSRDAMRMARIKSRDTFRKHIHDLHAFGYISYAPAHEEQVMALVQFKKI